MNNKISIKAISIGAMLCALSYVTVLLAHESIISFVPAAGFLKYDPKDIIIAIGGFIWGPWMSFSVSAIVSLLEIPISGTGIIGFVMNVISTCAFACTAAAIYKKKRTLSGAVIGLLAGCLTMSAVMMLWNYLITPLYMKIPRETVASMLLPAFLPFNLLKAGLNAGFTFLLYRPVVTALRKARLVESSKSESKKRIPVGLFILAGIIIITCVLFILSLNGII